MIDFDKLFMTRNWVGKPVRRNEDVRFVRGEGAYVDDLDVNCAHVAILRSIFAHARVRKIDTSRAEALKGVLAVVTGPEVACETKPLPPRAITASARQFAMAADKARFVGEPVAAVVAEDRYIAEDALDLIDVDYEPLPPVVQIEDALQPDAPVLFEEAGSNVLLHHTLVHGDIEKAYQEADLILKERFRVHRYSSTPLETWAIIARYNKATDSFVVWANDQQPGRSISLISSTLGIPQNRLRLMVPDIGGGFGIKVAIWPYAVILCLLARKVDRPVKWVQTRREHLAAGSHAADCLVELELPLKNDGTILGLGMKDFSNDGAFVHTAGVYGLIKYSALVGCYNIKATRAEFLSVATNKGPTTQNRGVGKPTMVFVLEKMVDIAARKLGLDPAEMRFRNFVQPSQMPYTTPSGEIYENGDYPECLRKALVLGKYEDLKRQRDELRAKGRYMGIGMSAGMEPGTANIGYYDVMKGSGPFMGNGEGAIVGIDYDGNANVLVGSVDTGQGHATTIGQVVSDMLGLSPDRVSVTRQVDSAISPLLGASGVYSNKFNDVDLGAVIKATEKVRNKMLRIAAHMLSVDSADSNSLKMADGAVYSVRNSGRRVSFREIASLAYKKISLLPEGIEPGLKEIAFYKNPIAKIPRKEDFNVQLTHANSVHLVAVEVDIETGAVSFLKYVIVHDCGNIINPAIVDGMTIGATVHGLGATFLEEFVYDDHGQLLASSFMDYLKPLSVEQPKFEIDHVNSPSPYTLLGTKAAGEGGAIGSLAAVANAVEDALAPFGVKVTSLPITPEKVVKAIRETGEI